MDWLNGNKDWIKRLSRQSKIFRGFTRSMLKLGMKLGKAGNPERIIRFISKSYWGTFSSQGDEKASVLDYQRLTEALTQAVRQSLALFRRRVNQ